MTRFLPRLALAVPSRIGLRIFAFNLLVLFLPVGGILYLDVYERELLATQERGMVQQARIVAEGLSGARELSTEAAPWLERLALQTDARIRVVAADGSVVADTAAGWESPMEPTEPSYAGTVDGRSPGLYRAGTWIAQRVRRVADRGRALLRSADSVRNAEASGPPPEVLAHAPQRAADPRRRPRHGRRRGVAVDPSHPAGALRRAAADLPGGGRVHRAGGAAQRADGRYRRPAARAAAAGCDGRGPAARSASWRGR